MEKLDGINLVIYFRGDWYLISLNSKIINNIFTSQLSMEKGLKVRSMLMAINTSKEKKHLLDSSYGEHFQEG